MIEITFVMIYFFILGLGRESLLARGHITVYVLNLQSLKLEVEQSNFFARWETLQNQENP